MSDDANPTPLPQLDLPLVFGPITIDPTDATVLRILGLVTFQTAPVAHLFRRLGYPIPRKIELEQAHVFLWLLGKYRDHGDGWGKAVADEIDQMQKAVEAKEKAVVKEIFGL